MVSRSDGRLSFSSGFRAQAVALTLGLTACSSGALRNDGSSELYPNEVVVRLQYTSGDVKDGEYTVTTRFVGSPHGRTSVYMSDKVVSERTLKTLDPEMSLTDATQVDESEREGPEVSTGAEAKVVVFHPVAAAQIQAGSSFQRAGDPESESAIHGDRRRVRKGPKSLEDRSSSDLRKGSESFRRSEVELIHRVRGLELTAPFSFDGGVEDAPAMQTQPEGLEWISGQDFRIRPYFSQGDPSLHQRRRIQFDLPARTQVFYVGLGLRPGQTAQDAGTRVGNSGPAWGEIDASAELWESLEESVSEKMTGGFFVCGRLCMQERLSFSREVVAGAPPEKISVRVLSSKPVHPDRDFMPESEVREKMRQWTELIFGRAIDHWPQLPFNQFTFLWSQAQQGAQSGCQLLQGPMVWVSFTPAPRVPSREERSAYLLKAQWTLAQCVFRVLSQYVSKSMEATTSARTAGGNSLPLLEGLERLMAVGLMKRANLADERTLESFLREEVKRDPILLLFLYWNERLKSKRGLPGLLLEWSSEMMERQSMFQDLTQGFGVQASPEIKDLDLLKRGAGLSSYSKQKSGIAVSASEERWGEILEEKRALESRSGGLTSRQIDRVISRYDPVGFLSDWQFVRSQASGSVTNPLERLPSQKVKPLKGIGPKDVEEWIRDYVAQWSAS